MELALAEYEAICGRPLRDLCQVDEETGELLPVVTIVTDNGGPFRSLNFQIFIVTHPELRHVSTRKKSPGQNGSRERGFGTVKYERLRNPSRTLDKWLAQARTEARGCTIACVLKRWFL